MISNVNSANMEMRETRLSSIIGFKGTVGELACGSRNCSLKDRGTGCKFLQSSSCVSCTAINFLAGIRDAALVYHGPAGCAALFPGEYIRVQQVAGLAGFKSDMHFVVNDLSEKDTVFGAIESLKETIAHTWNAYHPKAIFILSSCTAAVIGENIDDCVEEIKADYPIPIVPVHCEGFRSVTWAGGWDLAAHALLHSVVKPPKEKRNVINFINSNERMRKEITELFANFDLKVQFLVMNSTVEEIEHISESAVSATNCATWGSYLGNGLEELYGVPYVHGINPFGITGFESWLREICKAVGKSEECEKYIARQRSIYMPQFEKLKEQLTGLKCVIGMGSGFAFEIARALKEFGMEVQQMVAWHHDTKLDDGKIPAYLEYLDKTQPETPVTITPIQNYHTMNILNQYKPDIYVSRHPGLTVWAGKQGIPSIFFGDEYRLFGYKETIKFGKNILDSIRNRALEENLAAHCHMPYTSWWYNQKDDTFMAPDYSLKSRESCKEVSLNENAATA